MKLLGMVLVIVGVIGLIYGGFTWTTKDKVVDMGALQITRDKTQSLPLPPIAGGICLAAGVVLLITSSRQKA